tara:strand:- start:251 stop:493 length:243 start_codon:yes stop_codon:yes gene_type:complete
VTPLGDVIGGSLLTLKLLTPAEEEAGLPNLMSLALDIVNALLRAREKVLPSIMLDLLGADPTCRLTPETEEAACWRTAEK